KGAVTADDKQAVYERIIAHGGGIYKGYETTNSVEAVNQAIANGYKIIELDMELSSDNRIVMLHDWDRTAMHYYGTSFPKKLSQNQFMKLSVYGELEVLTFDKLVKILEKNQDIRIVTDTKGDNLELLAEIKNKYPNLVDQIIPQIYDYDQWSQVKELGYTDIIFTLYAMADLDAVKLASFVREHEIYAVAMPDYVAERGFCKQLSDRGIIVYVHPVSNYEAALQFMRQGAYGVYSGSLFPEEFTGIEKEYYLVVSDADGSVIKLTDDRIDDWKELKLRGQKAGETVLYYIDDSPQSSNNTGFSGLEQGKHKLTIKIYNKEELKGTLVYYLWKDTKNLRVLHKKYEYRLDAVRQEKDFDTAIQDGSVPEEIRDILEHSLIAKEGEYSFYFNGKLENYMNGEELLPVQKGSYGKLVLPLSTTVRRLGASSVSMDSTKDITIIFNKEKSMIMANSSIIRKGFQLTRLKTPVMLYLNKAMAGGEFYKGITGRDYIESDGRIILLPDGVKPDKEMEKQLLQSVGKLF
ncbi:MAG TPA: glycerophosphodiester phosphodiesterase family protein, partial [Anaerovoracaceae bacterium]|nr:glycerophosphodiester phosphodiesterase family protein [Anaerovoracaceae bacterium]